MSFTQRDNLKDSRKKDKKALFPFYQALDDYYFGKISKATPAKEAWRSFIGSNGKMENVLSLEEIVKENIMGDVVEDLEPRK